MLKILKNQIRNGLALAAVLVLFASPASALTLDQAKQQGMVKEDCSGYLVAVKSTDEVKALVKKINDGRKAEYKKIAQKRGTSLEAVEQLAGAKLCK